MKIKTNIVKLLAVLVILGSLVAIAAVPAFAADPTVTPTPSPAAGTVGASISIKAENYPAGSVLTAKFDGSAMSTSPATVTVPTPSVAVTFTVTIPVTTAGAHQIDVYQDGMNPLTIACTVTPKITITEPASKKGPVGTSVKVAGTGFSGAGVTADVRIGTTGLDTTDKMLVAGVLVDNTGSFTATGNVPQLGSGNQFVWARDGQNNNSATSLQSWNTFKVTPTLVITPSSGLAGSKVTLSGSGWNPGAITFKFGGVNWVGVTATADGNGQITLATGADKVIPTNAGAGIKVAEGTDTATQSGTFNFTVTPRLLTLTPTSGPMGTNVLVTGSDMTHDGTIANASALTFGGVNWNTYPGVSPYPIKIDTSGALFPTTLTVPTGAMLGANTVVAIDSGNLIAAGAFTVSKPTIAVSPTTSPKGTTVTITGSGWLPLNAVTIEFKAFGSAVVLSTLTTMPDGSGNIAASMAIPATAATGANTFSASDLQGGVKANVATDATYTVPGAAITVTPTEGAVTTSVTVSGTGFNPYFSIILSMGPAPAYEFQTRPLSGVTGAFSATITIPGLAPGSQVITAKDGTNTATAFFVIKLGAATVQTETAGISSQLVRIWGYSGGTWSMYDPADAAGSNLATLTAGNGYWVNANAACTLIYGGYSYALSTGWNLIGWR